jgi:LDH2 family malate/lactate/ureidoglycolate dehydrogenase
MILFQADQWRRIGRALFKAVGATEANAQRVTEAVVDASLVGHDSHGVIRILQYIQAIEKGLVDPAAKPEIIRETETICFVDGKWTFGQVGAEIAMRKAMAQAKRRGIAIAGLVHASHIGRLGEYSEIAYHEGLIGVVMTGGFEGVGGAVGKTGVAPFGGARPAFGTNPISFGIPAGKRPGVLVDFATSAVAGGKISMAKAKGVPLPEGCILDKEGRPTTDAEDFYDGGMLLAFGAHKGYGLAVVAELLGQVLTGADLCRDEPLGGGLYTRSGSIFLSIDPGIFRPFADFAAAADQFLNKIHDVPPAPGFKEVLIPGEPEHHARAQRTTEGIPLPENSWQTLQQQAVQYGVDLAVVMG